MTDVTETVKLFEICQIFCGLDASNRLPVPTTAIFMACTYYSCHFTILDFRACSALFSAFFRLLNSRKICPCSRSPASKKRPFRKSLKDSIRHFRFMLSPGLFRFLQSDTNLFFLWNTIKVCDSSSHRYCLDSLVCLMHHWILSGSHMPCLQSEFSLKKRKRAIIR